LTDSLRLPDQVSRAILAHAAWCAPDESCGLLAFDESGRIRFAYPLTNVDPSPVTYTVDPEEHFRAMRHAEEHGWEIEGVFHSHPKGPASPSIIDLRRAPDPTWVYLITDLDEVAAFRLDEGVTRVEIVTD
jgi:proteasome lid subunit RPN8/RPN11